MLLNDKSICKENRNLFAEFFEYEERKLKRSNGLIALDDSTYKTLSGYTSRFQTINKWFKNKPLKQLTKEDIKKVYDDLEDGKILSNMGKPFKDLRTYYNKIFKSKLFKLAGKDNVAREVIEFSRPHKEEVRFFEEEKLRKMVSLLKRPEHLLLFWLAWDIGENINSILKLKKKEFVKQSNKDTKEQEYKVNLPSKILKRSRQARSELTLYPETVKYADLVLANRQDDDLIFPFEYGTAKKVLQRICKKINGKCIPDGQPITWKDFRSSMACYLLDHEWSIDEINKRLGHIPSSREIDKYANFKAMSSHKPKKKLFDSTVEGLKEELEESKKREKMYALRMKELEENQENIEKNFSAIARLVQKKFSPEDAESIVREKEGRG